jgi:L-lactate utilization protein LutB
MDTNKKQIINKKIEKTLENLKRNNMQALYVDNKEQLIDKIKELIDEGANVTCGGSMTLFETGIMEHLRSGRYHLHDRYKPELTLEQVREIYISAFSSDAYICSSNAITEDGELYNVDGNSNRVAAMLYGPKSVIVIAGYNKIVKDIDEAVARVQSIAAPANAARLSCKTPCVETGHCTSCKSKDRICCNYVVMAQQRHKDRIKVIIVGEEFGY